MISRALTVCAVLLLSAQPSFDPSADAPSSSENLVKVEVAALLLNEQDRSVLLALKPVDGEESGARSSRVLPVVIGLEEGRSIGVVFHKLPVPRPLSHDLMKNIIEQYGGAVASCVITKMERETFFAELHLKRNGREFKIDSRPSDAIALALRSEAPVFVDRKVLDQHGIDPTKQQPEKALKT